MTWGLSKLYQIFHFWSNSLPVKTSESVRDVICFSSFRRLVNVMIGGLLLAPSSKSSKHISLKAVFMSWLKCFPVSLSLSLFPMCLFIFYFFFCLLEFYNLMYPREIDKKELNFITCIISCMQVSLQAPFNHLPPLHLTSSPSPTFPFTSLFPSFMWAVQLGWTSSYKFLACCTSGRALSLMSSAQGARRKQNWEKT